MPASEITRSSVFESSALMQEGLSWAPLGLDWPPEMREALAWRPGADPTLIRGCLVWFDEIWLQCSTNILKWLQDDYPWVLKEFNRNRCGTKGTIFSFPCRWFKSLCTYQRQWSSSIYTIPLWWPKLVLSLSESSKLLMNSGIYLSFLKL